jgi:hypothetical protein
MLRRLSEEQQGKNEKAMMVLEEKEPHLMYMLPLIEGYALKNKLWVSFYVEDLRDMVWNDEAYDHLVYDEQQKDLVMSFVENHGAAAERRKKNAMLRDVIAGKGEFLFLRFLVKLELILTDPRRGSYPFTLRPPGHRQNPHGRGRRRPHAPPALLPAG